MKCKNVKLLPMANISPFNVSQDSGEEINGRKEKKSEFMFCRYLKGKES